MMFIALLMGSITDLAGQCTTPRNLTTFWGHQNVVMVLDEPVRRIDGKASILGGEPIEGVLVEIFDHPEIVSEMPGANRVGQKRLVACVTGKNGEFAFKLPEGKYEVRLSKPVEWNSTSMLIEVKKSAPRRNRVNAVLWLAE